MKTFSQYINESITSSTGNNIVTYFETGQGSKYLLTDKGESKRWKSEHSNTGGEDMGLKNWYQKSFFINPKFETVANSVQILVDKWNFKIKEIGLSKNKDKDELIIYIIKNGKWVQGNWLDAYPSQKKDESLAFEYTKIPKIGLSVVECDFNSDNFSIRHYHVGSSITKILPIDKVDKQTLDLFIKK